MTLTSSVMDRSEREDEAKFEKPLSDGHLQTGQIQAIHQGFQDHPTTMTKSQAKKLARKQRLLDKRPEKRRLEREKKRLKKKELAEARKKQSEDGNQVIQVIEKPRIKLMSESSNRFKVVIDMDFENFMTDDEIGKAAKQCKRAYATNRRSQNPCQLFFTSVKGRIRDRFNVTCAGYESWDANVSSECYIDTMSLMLSKDEGEIRDQNSVISKMRDLTRQNIIYLTGDSDQLLPDVDEILKDESIIFVIGGLVDHNRHKNLCHSRATERGLKTARLPISENLRLCQRHILSTVTVFDILLSVLGDRRSWRQALIAAIPRRKIHPSELVEDEKEQSTI